MSRLPAARRSVGSSSTQHRENSDAKSYGMMSRARRRMYAMWWLAAVRSHTRGYSEVRYTHIQPVRREMDER